MIRVLIYMFFGSLCIMAIKCAGLLIMIATTWWALRALGGH
jgi:uncharacterized membrane protein YwzB